MSYWWRRVYLDSAYASVDVGTGHWEDLLKLRCLKEDRFREILVPLYKWRPNCLSFHRLTPSTNARFRKSVILRAQLRRRDAVPPTCSPVQAISMTGCIRKFSTGLDCHGSIPMSSSTPYTAHPNPHQHAMPYLRSEGRLERESMEPDISSHGHFRL